MWNDEVRSFSSRVYNVMLEVWRVAARKKNRKKTEKTEKTSPKFEICCSLRYFFGLQPPPPLVSNILLEHRLTASGNFKISCKTFFQYPQDSNEIGKDR